MDLLWISVAVGLVVGGLMSTIFGLYNRAGSEPYIRMLFGISSYDLIFNGIILILAIGFLFLAVIAFFIRDLTYPVMKPFNFTVETLLMAFLPASILLVMAPLRGYKIDLTVLEEFGILTLKFGALHLLLQFSGFYSNIFAPPVMVGAKR